jgi:hypothetical protein
MAKKAAYISSKPMTHAMIDIMKKRLKLDLVEVLHIDEFHDDPVAILSEWDKTCRDIVTDSASLAVAVRSGLTKYGVTVFREENTASEGESTNLEITGCRYYSRDGMVFDMPA